MKRNIFFVLLLFFSLSGFAQSNSKETQIRKLLDITGSVKLGTESMDRIIETFKTNFNNVPAEFWDEFRSEIDAEGLIKLIVPIYDKYYSEEDVRQLIAFYETPLGKKLIEKTPFILRDSFTSGQQWGKEIGARVVERLKEKGYSTTN